MVQSHSAQCSLAALSCLSLFPKHADGMKHGVCSVMCTTRTLYLTVCLHVHHKPLCTVHADCGYSPNWLALQCLRVRTVSAIICWKASRKQVSGRVAAGAAQVARLLGPMGIYTLGCNLGLDFK